MTDDTDRIEFLAWNPTSHRTVDVALILNDGAYSRGFFDPNNLTRDRSQSSSGCLHS
jgi:hypothetical protein